MLGQDAGPVGAENGAIKDVEDKSGCVRFLSYRQNHIMMVPSHSNAPSFRWSLT